MDADLEEFRKNPPAFITVDLQRYQELEDDSERYHALEAAGVDNWEGYSDAMADLYDNDSDEEDD